MLHILVQLTSRMNINTNTSIKRTTVKLLVIELLYWLCSALFSYFSVYFQSIGFSASETGKITALNLIIGVITVPLWGLLSDKIKSTKKILIINIIGTSIFYCLIPTVVEASKEILIISIIVVLSSVFRSPLSTLVDNIVIRSSNKWGLNYGFLIAIGCMGAAMTSIMLGIVIPVIGAEKTFILVPMITLLMLSVVIFTNEERDIDNNNATKKVDIRITFKNYSFITFLAFTLIVSIATQSNLTFSPYLLADIGVDGSKVGIVLGWQGIIQILVLLNLKKLKQKYALYKMLIVAGISYSIVCFSFGIAQSFTSILFLATFAGIGSGLLLACCNFYLFEIAEAELVTTYQSLMNSTILLAGIFGNLIGGKLIDAIGIRHFYQSISFLVFWGTLLYVLSFKLKVKKEKKGENTNVAR